MQNVSLSFAACLTLLCVSAAAFLVLGMYYLRNFNSLRALIRAEYADEARRVFAAKSSLGADPFQYNPAGAMDQLVSAWPFWQLNIQDQRYRTLLRRVRVSYFLCLLFIVTTIIALALTPQSLSNT